MLFVLLTPCVDYVIVFSGLAGGARDRLLAATPLLMVLQILLLPVYLWAMAGGALVGTLDATPFIEAFLLLIVLPLLMAALTQVCARRSAAVRGWEQSMSGAMVPLMMVVLAVVVASQITGVAGAVAQLVSVVPIFVVLSCRSPRHSAPWWRAWRGWRLPARRSVVFGGTTRNSLVVLPLALALRHLRDTPLVVVTPDPDRARGNGGDDRARASADPLARGSISRSG